LAPEPKTLMANWGGAPATGEGISREGALPMLPQAQSSRAIPGWPVYVLIFLLPLEVYAIDLSTGPHLYPAFAFMALQSPFFLLHLLEGRIRIPKVPVTRLFCFYLLVALSTVAGTEDPRASWVGWGAAFFTVLAYLYTSAYLDSREKIERALSTFILIGVIVALMGLVEFFGFILFLQEIHPPFAFREQQGGYGFAGGLMRMHGFFTSSNRVGSYLLIPFGFSLYRFNVSKRARLLYLILALFLALTIILSLARNSYLAVLLFFLCLFFFKRKPYPLRSAALTSLGILLLGVLAYINPVTGIPLLDSANPFTRNTEIENPSGNLDLLMTHSRVSWRAGLQNLGLGRGIQNYDDWAFDTGEVSEWSSHSNWLQFLGETGVIGFSLQLAAVLSLIGLTLRHLGRSGGRDPLAVYLVSIYIGMVFAGIVRTYYYADYVWVLIGIMVSHLQLGVKSCADSSGQ